MNAEDAHHYKQKMGLRGELHRANGRVARLREELARETLRAELLTQENSQLKEKQETQFNFLRNEVTRLQKENERLRFRLIESGKEHLLPPDKLERFCEDLSKYEHS